MCAFLDMYLPYCIQNCGTHYIIGRKSPSVTQIKLKFVSLFRPDVFTREMANKVFSLILVLFLVITLAATLLESKPQFRGRGGIAGQVLHDVTRAIGGRGRGLDLGGLREILGKQITF